MKRVLMLLLALITVFSMTACKKTDTKDATEKNETEAVDANKEEKKEVEAEEKQEESEASKEDAEIDNYQKMVLDISDTDLAFVQVDGKNYIDLKEFSDFLNVSKHRFDVKIDEEKNRIKLNQGLFLEDKEYKKVNTEDKLDFKDYTLSLKGQKAEAKVAVANDNALVEPMALAEVLGFTFEKVDEETARIVFEDADEKEMEASNDRDYDWYMDQAHTGEYSDGNCGPTSTAMVLKWVDQNSDATGESCRNEVLNDGNWWNTNIVESYFKEHNVNFETKLYKDAEVITDAIDKGDIVFVCIKMGEISQNTEPDQSKMGRFYNFDGGHFLVIKGYKIVDGELYYEVYDPNTWDMKYSESGEPMGKDRLYKASEMDSAIRNWWSMVYPISQESK